MILSKIKFRKSVIYLGLGLIFTGIFLIRADAATIRRIDGPDRYQTSLNVADHHKSDMAIVVVKTFQMPYQLLVLQVSIRQILY